MNERARQQQLAPQWRAEEFRTLATQGLDGQPVVVGGVAEVRALGVLWDQRGCKQVVVRGYDGALALGRPVVNVAARLCGWPGLPAVGEPVALAFGAALAVAAEDAGALVEVVRGLRARAAARGGAWLGLGFDARDPRLATVRRHFRRREYRSRLYAVSWPGMTSVESWADGLFSPEVALL